MSPLIPRQLREPRRPRDERADPTGADLDRLVEVAQDCIDVGATLRAFIAGYLAALDPQR